MYGFGKQGIVSVRDPDRLGIKGNRRKEALRKLAEYLRNERGYSENEIRKFMAKSFIGKIEYSFSTILLRLIFSVEDIREKDGCL